MYQLALLHLAEERIGSAQRAERAAEDSQVASVKRARKK